MTARKLISVPAFVSEPFASSVKVYASPEKPYVVKLHGWSPDESGVSSATDGNLFVGDSVTSSGCLEPWPPRDVSGHLEDWMNVTIDSASGTSTNLTTCDWERSFVNEYTLPRGVTSDGTSDYIYVDPNVRWVDEAAYRKYRRETSFVDRMRRNMVEHVRTNHRGDPIRAAMSQSDYSSESELCALSLLKSLLDPVQWRQYLTYGFFMLRGMSGLQYQVWKGRKHVVVYSVRGRKLAELCVNPKCNVPPSDCAVMKLLLIRSSEAGFWGRANVYARFAGVSSETVFERRMVEAA